MDRDEALLVLKEIAKACKGLAIKQISLKPVTESIGYELHIQNHFDKYYCENLTKIIQKHNLAMRKYDGTTVIYKPKPN